MNQEKIGEFITKLRKENNLTQEELAEKIGVSNKSISRWENGKTLPDISILLQLSEELNITLPELLKGRRLTKEELTKQKEIIESIIEYDTSRKYGYNMKFMKLLIAGLFITSLAIINDYYPFLDLIFTPNVSDFVQGFMYGIGVPIELISVYNLTKNLTHNNKKQSKIFSSRLI